MTLYRVHVTAEDIAKGRRDSCVDCPIARALKRVTTDEVQVTSENIQLGDASVHPPHAARMFVFAFDEGRPVEPFSFSLEVSS